MNLHSLNLLTKRQVVSLDYMKSTCSLLLKDIAKTQGHRNVERKKIQKNTLRKF